jgi:hypothetical protein
MLVKLYINSLTYNAKKIKLTGTKIYHSIPTFKKTTFKQNSLYQNAIFWWTIYNNLSYIHTYTTHALFPKG